jgi:hypothetical protein
MSILREAILAADDLEAREVEVPEWPHPDGGNIVLMLRSPTLARRNQLMRLFSNARITEDGSVDQSGMDWDALSSALLSEMVYDPDDVDAGPVFAEPAHRDALLEKSGAVCWRIVTECMELAGFRDAEEAPEELSPESALVDAGKDSSSSTIQPAEITSG